MSAAVDYVLHTALSKTKRCRLVPPRPKKGERQPVPYSKPDLDSLRATCDAFKPLAMVTLKAPPLAPLVTWPQLHCELLKLKALLTNLKGRRGFPAALCVTEFDPVEMDGQEVPGGAFHIGFAEPLTAGQQEWFQDWWLARVGQVNNQGRFFQHDARGGGKRLEEYLAKDVTFRDRQPRPVKFRPEWMPERLPCRLWFCVGMKRRPASEGRKLRAHTGRVLKSFESEHGKSRPPRLKASTEERESEHAMPLITTDQGAGPPVSLVAVATAEMEAVPAAPIATQAAPNGVERPQCSLPPARWVQTSQPGSWPRLERCETKGRKIYITAGESVEVLYAAADQDGFNGELICRYQGAELVIKKHSLQI